MSVDLLQDVSDLGRGFVRIVQASDIFPKPFAHVVLFVIHREWSTAEYVQSKTSVLLEYLREHPLSLLVVN